MCVKINEQTDRIFEHRVFIEGERRVNLDEFI